MQLDEIKDLIKQFSESDIGELELKYNGCKLKMKKSSNSSVATVVQQDEKPVRMLPAANTVQPATMTFASEQAQSQSAKQTGENFAEVKAPMVGVFYVAQDPQSKPFVTVGDKVEKGDVIGLIEAMKMMSEIKATASGIVRSIDVANEQLVAFDDILIRIEE